MLALPAPEDLPTVVAVEYNSSSLPYDSGWLDRDLERKEEPPAKADLKSGRSDATEAQTMAALTSICDQRRTSIVS